MKLQVFAVLGLLFALTLAGIVTLTAPATADTPDNSAAVYLQNWGTSGCTHPYAAVSENPENPYLANWGHTACLTTPASSPVPGSDVAPYLQNWGHTVGTCTNCQPGN